MKKNDFHSIQFCGCHTPLEFHSLAPQETSTLNNSTACIQAGSNKTLELTSNSQRQMTATNVFHLNGKGFTIKLALQNSLNHPTLIFHVATVGSMHLSSLSWKGDIKIEQEFYQKYGSIQSRTNVLFKRAANSFRHLGRQVCCLPAVAISRKDRKHRLENMFFKLSSYGLVSMWY